ncbi:chloroplastic,Alpha-glucan water dikinase 1 [Trichinella spiralis]|uniref:Chloroplastic,Alpha-glucan water dikinase 1 n=1 Tax=Trichinella spiralis TaxID=6334 RepID=A0ABR3KA20_TRISP
MDCDLHVRLTRSGRIIQKLIVLPDVDISEPETDSVDDQRSSFVVESSAKLTSDDEETETFKKTEFRWKKKRMPPIDATFKETASDSSCVLQEPVEYFRQYFHPTLLNILLSNLTSMRPSNAIENGTCSNAAVFDVLVYGAAV